MKKVKIMLLSLLVLAAVSAVLAFHTKFNRTYCYTDSVQIAGGEWTCPFTTSCSTLVSATTQGGFGNAVTLCITPKPLGVNCSQVRTCITLTTVKRDFQ